MSDKYSKGRSGITYLKNPFVKQKIAEQLRQRETLPLNRLPEEAFMIPSIKEKEIGFVQGLLFPLLGIYGLCLLMGVIGECHNISKEGRNAHCNSYLTPLHIVFPARPLACLMTTPLYGE